MGNRINKRLTIAQKEAIVKAYHDEKLSFVQIEHKFKISNNTVKKICRTMEYGFWDNLPEEEKEPVTRRTDRRHLTKEKREELLSNDAMDIIERTFHAMKTKLENPGKLSASQLTSFVAVAAPYVLPKRVEDKKKDKGKSGNDLFRAFKFHEQ
jgi:DNA-binding MarR family transcriptional regulator